MARPLIQEQELQTERGAILYDAVALSKSGVQAAHDIFGVEYWQGRVEVSPAGRGNVAFITLKDEQWVVRHYRRGGMVARFNRDRYLWSGRDATRSFAEWRLLVQLRTWELPVPAPIAAHFIREGAWYRADLITRAIPHTRTLAESIVDGLSDHTLWRNVGGTLARFHARGVHHADLNAHNMLVDESGQVHVLDFDRGRIETRGAWEDVVLDRLHRSLRKVCLQRQTLFEESSWEAMLGGYRAALAPRL